MLLNLILVSNFWVQIKNAGGSFALKHLFNFHQFDRNETQSIGGYKPILRSAVFALKGGSVRFCAVQMPIDDRMNVIWFQHGYEIARLLGFGKRRIMEHDNMHGVIGQAREGEVQALLFSFEELSVFALFVTRALGDRPTSGSRDFHVVKSKRIVLQHINSIGKNAANLGYARPPEIVIALEANFPA